MAGLVFTAVFAPNFYLVKEWTLESTLCAAAYHIWIQLAMIFSVLSMIVSTIASSFGPTLTLTGKSSKMIIYGNNLLLLLFYFFLIYSEIIALRSMQNVQEYSFWLATISIVLIFFAIPFYAYKSIFFFSFFFLSWILVVDSLNMFELMQLLLLLWVFLELFLF